MNGTGVLNLVFALIKQYWNLSVPVLNLLVSLTLVWEYMTLKSVLYFYKDLRFILYCFKNCSAVQRQIFGIFYRLPL